MKVPVYNTSGEVVEEVEIKEEVFGVPINQAVVHQVMVGQRANRRRGTSDTKTRGEVSGGGRKPWAQKHTGRARQGSTRAPHWRHGGITFGPHPRSYQQHTPKKMKRLALKSLLSSKLGQGQLKILNSLDMPDPSTKALAAVLATLGFGRSAILSTPSMQPNILKSARNLPKVKILPANLLNVADLLDYQGLVMTLDAVRMAEDIWSRPVTRGSKVPASA